MKNIEKIKESLKSSRNTMILIVIATVAIGLIYIFSPVPAMEVISYIIAGAMCIYGVFSFAEYFVKSRELAFGSFGLVRGLIAVFFGVFIFLNPAFITNMLATLVGIALIVDGVTKAQYAIDLLRIKSEKWWHLLIPSAVTVVLGFITALNPNETAKWFMIFVGISLIIDALCALFTMFFLSSCVNAVEEEQTAFAEIEEE